MNEAKRFFLNAKYGKKGKMATQKKIVEEEKKEEKTYKRPVLFLRKSKAGEHLYTFNRDGALGNDVESLIFNVSDVKKLLDSSMEWIKISVMSAEKEDEKEEV